MKRSPSLIAFALALTLTALAVAAAPPDLTIAAASDLTFAMNDLSAGFQRASGHAVTVSTGSSGNFATQIQNGAPFDLFFSADLGYPQQVQNAGLAEPGSLYIYATGRIVLWVPNNSPLDLTKGLDVLLDPRAAKIAIANPEHAPYGRAAVAALRSAGLYDRVSSRLVLGDNISQAEEFVDSGNAQIGILANSLVASPTMKDRGRSWTVPDRYYEPLQQAAVILRSSASKQVARDFLTYVQSPKGQATLRQYGFAPPTAAPAAAHP